MATVRNKDGSNVEAEYNAMRGVSFVKGILTNGTPVVQSMLGAPLPATVWVRPTNSDTVRLEYSVDDAQNWNPWPKGDVSVYTEDRLNTAITDIRITRQAGSGTTSSWGIV